MRVRVWDLPVRLTHWALVACVAVAFVSAKVGGNLMVWHGRAGLAILGLVVFRIVWGFVGSRHARFADFVHGPAAVLAYLRGEWSGLGHNPLGALSVLALLTLMLALVVTGLFANDDIAYQGYLYPLVGADLSSQITGVHKLFEPLLIVLVLAHVGAIAFYARVRKTNLVLPMVTGWKDVPDAGDEAPAKARWPGLLLAFAIAAASVVGASGALLPPPPPAAETPDW